MLIDRLHRRGLDPRCECVENPPPASVRQSLGQGRVAEDSDDRLSHCGWILGRHQEAIDVGANDLGDAAAVNRDDGTHACHGLDHRQTEWLLDGRVREDVERAIKWRAYPSGKRNRARSPRHAGRAHQYVASECRGNHRGRLAHPPPRAQPDQPRGRQRLSNQCERLEQRGLPFAAHQARGAADEWHVGRDAQLLAHLQTPSTGSVWSTDIAIDGVVYCEDAVLPAPCRVVEMSGPRSRRRLRLRRPDPIASWRIGTRRAGRGSCGRESSMRCLPIRATSNPNSAWRGRSVT